MKLTFPPFCKSDLNGAILDVTLYRQKFRGIKRDVSIQFSGSTCFDPVSISETDFYLAQVDSNIQRDCGKAAFPRVMGQDKSNSAFYGFQPVDLAIDESY